MAPKRREALPELDAKLALTALLIRVARSDNNFCLGEKRQIERVLCENYGLSEDEARSLRKEAEEIESEATDTVRFTRVLKEAVSVEDRSHLLETLWSLALADGERDYREDSHIRLISELLYVTGKESAFARQRAIERIEAER